MSEPSTPVSATKPTAAPTTGPTEAKKLADVAEPYFQAISHRVAADDMVVVRKHVLAGIDVAMANLNGTGDRGKITAWRKAIEAVGPLMAAEILGVVLGIVDLEVRKRMDLFRSDILGA